MKKIEYSKVTGKQRILLPTDHPMYCCQHFQECILDDLDIAIGYNSPFRLYYWITSKRDTSIRWITRCPSCGKKWPKELQVKYYRTIKKELGFNAMYEKNDHLIPDEFRSDEWWKKRGIK